MFIKKNLVCLYTLSFILVAAQRFRPRPVQVGRVPTAQLDYKITVINELPYVLKTLKLMYSVDKVAAVGRFHFFINEQCDSTLSAPFLLTDSADPPVKTPLRTLMGPGNAPPFKVGYNINVYRVPIDNLFQLPPDDDIIYQAIVVQTPDPATGMYTFPIDLSLPHDIAQVHPYEKLGAIDCRIRENFGDHNFMAVKMMKPKCQVSPDPKDGGFIGTERWLESNSYKAPKLEEAGVVCEKEESVKACAQRFYCQAYANLDKDKSWHYLDASYQLQIPLFNYGEKCRKLKRRCRTAFYQLHQMMGGFPLGPERNEDDPLLPVKGVQCTNFARKALRAIGHDRLPDKTGAIDGSLLDELDAPINQGLCRYGKFVEELADKTKCDAGSIIEMAGHLAIYTCIGDTMNYRSYSSLVLMNRLKKNDTKCFESKPPREMVKDPTFLAKTFVDHFSQYSFASHMIGRVTCAVKGTGSTEPRDAICPGDFSVNGLQSNRNSLLCGGGRRRHKNETNFFPERDFLCMDHRFSDFDKVQHMNEDLQIITNAPKTNEATIKPFTDTSWNLFHRWTDDVALAKQNKECSYPLFEFIPFLVANATLRKEEGEEVPLPDFMKVDDDSYWDTCGPCKKDTFVKCNSQTGNWDPISRDPRKDYDQAGSICKNFQTPQAPFGDESEPTLGSMKIKNGRRAKETTTE